MENVHGQATCFNVLDNLDDANFNAKWRQLLYWGMGLVATALVVLPLAICLVQERRIAKMDGGLRAKKSPTGVRWLISATLPCLLLLLVGL
mmetsp:Transcript_38592/g.69103  ORF Transcript_38592/g.69103 Transcript_38592/m.69103 type:complete len:91 (-) Transcript_38592:60-332(-)